MPNKQVKIARYTRWDFQKAALLSSLCFWKAPYLSRYVYK